MKSIVAAAAVLAAMAQSASAQDVTAGEQSFKKCLPCHAIGEGAKNKVGPELNGIDGHPIETTSAALTLDEVGNTLFGVLETEPDAVTNEAHVRLATLTDQHVSSSFAPIIVQQVSPTSTSNDIIAALQAAGIFI